MTFTQVLNVSVSASWLVLGILLLRLALKKAPRAFHCALWALVAVRLLCPFSFESSLSLVPVTQVVSEEYLTMEPAEDLSQPVSVTIVENPVYPENVTIPLNTTVDRVQNLDIYWTIAWWTGMGVMAVYALCSYLSLRLRVRYSVKLRENIWLCDDVDSPFILGILRPRIYLPSAMDPEQMPHVIAHERAHLKRLDHWWKPVGFALLTVHWFNPVMRVAYVLLCKDIELACDEAVIRNLDKSSVRQYSEALVACSVRQRYIAACPLAFGEVGVKERVKTMLNYKKPGFWVILIALVLSVVLVVCFMTDPAGTTIGTSFKGLFQNAEVLTFRYGTYYYTADGTDELLSRLNAVALDPEPVSQSLDEARDRTYEVEAGSSTLCVSADFSEVWVDDGVKPSYSYSVEQPEELKQLLGEYIPGIEDVAVSWLDLDLDRIVYQDGYRITSQKAVDVTLRLDVSVLPEDIYTDEGHTFEENEIVVYRKGSNTIYLHHMGYDDPEGEYLICTFALSHTLADSGSAVLDCRVNLEDGKTVSFTKGLALTGKDLHENWERRPNVAYLRGENPGYQFCINIQTEAMRAAKGEIEFYLDGFYEISYTRAESLENPVFSGTYVPYQCIYMNGLSSYYAFGGDSGCVYHFDETSFTIESRNGWVTVYDPVDWNWQAIDWTAPPFGDFTEDVMFWTGGSVRTLLGEKCVYQMMDGDCVLVYDGTHLTILYMTEPNVLGRAPWCAYYLVPESAMGMAQWEFDPLSSAQYPGFRFAFDMDYTAIHAFTQDGTLISFDVPSEEGYPSGSWLEFPEGTALYWSPVDEKGNQLTEGEISVSVVKGDYTSHECTIYITSEETESGRRLYTARIVGYGLHLDQNEEVPGGVIGSTLGQLVQAESGEQPTLAELEAVKDALTPYMVEYHIATLDANEVTGMLDIQMYQENDAIYDLVESMIDLQYVNITVLPEGYTIEFPVETVPAEQVRWPFSSVWKDLWK